jgi:Flp pilus assembly protein TadD
MALTFEAEGRPDTPQVRQLGYLSLAHLDQALAQRPDDLIAIRMRARAMALVGRQKKAVQLDERVLKSAPSYEQVLGELVSHTIELGMFQTALDPARRAVALNPWSAGLHERLAYVHVQREDWNGAFHEAREALRLNPFLRFARMFLIQSLLHQQDQEGAAAEVETLGKLNPNERESLERWFAETRRGHGS